MSTEHSKQAQSAQILKMLSRNPDLLAKNPALFSDVLASLKSGSEVSFISFNPPTETEKEMANKIRSQMEDMSQQVTLKVLEQVRLEIPKLFEAFKSQLSASKKIEAVALIVKMTSEIHEARKVYVGVEQEGLRITVIHDSAQRLELLRKIMEIESLLDARYEDIFFQFDALHYTEVDENSMSNDLLVFLRS